MKKRVTGLGGFFFKCKDPDKIKQWYREHLGMDTDRYGWSFWWKDQEGKDCMTQWSPMAENTDHFLPSHKQFMMNFRVENLEQLLDVLKAEGVQVVGQIERYDYGKFAWILDPEGNKLELWEPNDKAFR